MSLSAAVHVVVLGLAATVLLPPPQLIELLRVSLRSGGGHGNTPAGPAQRSVDEVAAPAPAPPPVAPQQLQPARRIARVRPQRAESPTAPIEAAAIPARVDAAAGIQKPASSGDDSGTGGTLAGAGTGAGNGAGRGVGSGVGDGDDTRPYCDYCPAPSYPLIARRRGWNGTVDVGLVLLADGRVDSATLRHSSGHDVLDREAIEVARRSRFHFPTNTTGGPVFGRIEYRFELLPAP